MTPTDVPTVGKQWLTQTNEWRERLTAGLAGPYGWWSITGLTWLDDQHSLVGSSEEAAVRLPGRFPARVATLTLGDGQVGVMPEPAAELLVDAGRLVGAATYAGDQAFLLTDPSAAPGGSASALRLNLIRRGDLWGVRVHDPQQAQAADPAQRMAWFEPDPEWIIEAEFLPADGTEEVPVSNVIGQVAMTPVAGRVRFQLGGSTHTLLATPAGKERLFINFRDGSNEDLDAPSVGLATYSGGRFLVTGAPADGRVTLDFNRAYHPPCAHTPYATCPMPTPGNKLDVAVTAGERLAGR